MLKQMGILMVVGALLTACGTGERYAASYANASAIPWDEISAPRNITHVYGSNLIQSGQR